MNEISINNSLCVGCNKCNIVCPQGCFSFENNHMTVNMKYVAGCISCGQCVAICDNNAITHSQYEEDDLFLKKKSIMGYVELTNFLQNRRSIRRFADRPINAKLIDKLLNTAAYCPSGSMPTNVEILVVNDKQKINSLLNPIFQEYKKLMMCLNSSMGKVILKKQNFDEAYLDTMENYFKNILPYYLDKFYSEKTNEFTRESHLLLIFHGDETVHDLDLDAAIAAYNTSLVASSLDLGTSIVGFISPIANMIPAIKEKFGITHKNKIITSLIVGYPKISYSKSIKRTFKSVKYY